MTRSSLPGRGSCRKKREIQHRGRAHSWCFLPTNYQSLLNSTTTVKLEFKEPASVYGGLGLVAIETISAAEDVHFKKQMLAVLHPSRVHHAYVCNMFMVIIVLHKLAKNNYKSTAVSIAL
jgi:hypothetical protein